MGWVDRTSTDNWTIVTGSWDSGNSRYVGASGEGSKDILLQAYYDSEGGGSCWYCAQEQTKIRVTFTSTGDSDITVRLYDLSSNNIVYDTTYESLDENVCSYTAENNIYRLALNSFGSDLYVTKIEFDETGGGATEYEVGSTDYIDLDEEGHREVPLNDGNVDYLGFDTIGDQETLNDGSAEEIAFEDIGGQETLNDGSIEEVALEDTEYRIKEVSGGNSDEVAFEDTEADAFNFTKWLRENEGKYILRYEVILTGDADGLSDLTLPVSSIQMRMRTEQQTYVGVIIPDVDNYSASITARSNGEIIVYLKAYVNGVESLSQELISVAFETIATYKGATNQSIQISGHKTITFASYTIPLRNVTYRSLQQNGKLRFRCAEPDFYLRPNMTVTYDTDEIVIDYITYAINANSATMELTGT